MQSVYFIAYLATELWPCILALPSSLAVPGEPGDTGDATRCNTVFLLIFYLYFILYGRCSQRLRCVLAWCSSSASCAASPSRQPASPPAALNGMPLSQVHLLSHCFTKETQVSVGLPCCHLSTLFFTLSSENYKRKVSCSLS